MTRQKLFPSMTVLAVLFGLAIIVQFSKVPVLLAEDEMDEELSSTIPSDPNYRGQKRSAPTPAAAPTPAESTPPPAAEPAKSATSTPSAAPSSSGGGENEGDEWRTMRSETHRPWAGASSIQIDLTKNRIFTPKIGFGANSAVPTPQSTTTLKRLAETLGKRSDLSVRIEGHTDSIGYDQPNLELSQKRADQVRDILVQNGVPANRLQSVGKGDRYPVASSTTSEGQEKNRRVEFHISGVTAAPAPVAATTPAPQPVPTAPAPARPAPAPVAAAPTPTPQPPVAPAPVPAASVPVATVGAVPAASAPPPAAPVPQAMTPTPAPASIPAAPAPAPAPGLVAPPSQPAPAAPPPAPFGVAPK